MGNKLSYQLMTFAIVDRKYSKWVDVLKLCFNRKYCKGTTN